MNEEQAQKRIDELKDYYGHLASYVAVNLFLFAINAATGLDTLWFIYPLLGWGIGIAIHTFEVFGTSADWESRKMLELTGISDTREELARLSERTDNLVTILASVDWEKIDPELLQTQKNLEATKEKVVALQTGETSQNTSSQAEVAREIEKLEEFVTSTKFDYYELAAVDANGQTKSASDNRT